MEAEGMRQQFPFYNELQAIFTARMQRMVNSKKRELQDLLSSDEEDDYDGETTESRAKKKRKIKGNANPSGSGKLFIREIMGKLMKQQLEMENQWLKAYEEKEEERRIKEMEWRQTMEDLENERIMMDSRWREREEQWRIREETRAEKMDVLITALLNKLTRDDM
ncbi:Trihelix transcription factor GT-3b [Forsythia ovata]